MHAREERSAQTSPKPSIISKHTMPRRKKETANGADQDVALKRSRTQPDPGPAAEPADAEEDDQPAAAPSRLQGMADVARRCTFSLNVARSACQ